MTPNAKTKLRYETQNGRAREGRAEMMRDNIVIIRGDSLSQSHTAPPTSLPTVLVMPPIEMRKAALPPSTP